MPAIAPIPPWALKGVLELFGYSLDHEDEYNWMLVSNSQPDAEPIVLPKIGDLVAVDVMMQSFISSKMGLAKYFELKKKVLGDNWGYPNAAAASAGGPVN